MLFLFRWSWTKSCQLTCSSYPLDLYRWGESNHIQSACGMKARHEACGFPEIHNCFVTCGLFMAVPLHTRTSTDFRPQRLHWFSTRVSTCKYLDFLFSQSEYRQRCRCVCMHWAASKIFRVEKRKCLKSFLQACSPHAPWVSRQMAACSECPAGRKWIFHTG